MCGRVAIHFTWAQIHEQLAAMGAALTTESRRREGPTPSYNVAPTQQIPALRAGSATLGELEGVMLRWWLLPFWARESTSKYPMFNARSEDAANKPAFREPFRKRRCVIPVSGFYEWEKREKGAKQPYYITRADGTAVFFAGLWDRWVSPSGESIESCTVLTTVPNAEMKRVHHRMPCVLEPERVAAWADPAMQDAEEVQRFLGPAADGVLTLTPVSTRVNNARNDGAELIEAEDGGLFGGEAV